EPIWNRNHIAYVQIDVPETLSIAGRGSFYDQTGAYRDMIVTHLLQVLGFVAMEPPTSFDARHLRDETAKVFDALKPIDVRHAVRGWGGGPGPAARAGGGPRRRGGTPGRGSAQKPTPGGGGACCPGGGREGAGPPAPS